MPGCRGLVSDETTPVAIQVVAPPDTILVGDTVAIEVHALNRSGDTIPGAPLGLRSFNPDTVGVVAGTLSVTGLMPGPGQVQAFSGNLPGTPFRIVVQ